MLGWTEALTLLPETRAPDDEFEALKQHFSDEEIVKITVAIGTINVWNRMAVGFRTPASGRPAVGSRVAELPADTSRPLRERRRWRHAYRYIRPKGMRCRPILRRRSSSWRAC